MEKRIHKEEQKQDKVTPTRKETSSIRDGAQQEDQLQKLKPKIDKDKAPKKTGAMPSNNMNKGEKE